MPSTQYSHLSVTKDLISDISGPQFSTSKSSLGSVAFLLLTPVVAALVDYLLLTIMVPFT